MKLEKYQWWKLEYEEKRKHNVWKSEKEENKESQNEIEIETRRKEEESMWFYTKSMKNEKDEKAWSSSINGESYLNGSKLLSHRERERERE